MKKLVSLLLAFAMLFSLCVPFAGAEEMEEQEPAGSTFHAPTIRSMIEVNLELDNFDEEFYHILANAYITDPVLLAQTVADLSGEEITYLAKAISYDLQKTDRVELAVLPEECGSDAANAAARLIIAEAGNTANASMTAFLDEEMTASMLAPAAELADTTSLYISIQLEPEEFASTTEAVDVTVTAVTFAMASSAQSYFYQIYKVIDGVDSIAAAGRITIPANTLGANITKSITFNAAGTYQVYAVLLYELEQVASSTRHTMYVDGQWHITVELPSNRNYKGTLTLYDASGTAILTADCLGLSQYGTPMNVENGNTPTGEYTAWLGGIYSSYSYGPYRVIETTPVSGVVKESGRSEIWIHGGDPSSNTSSAIYPFRPTNGCVRVTNATQLELQNLITSLIEDSCHKTTGTVSIVQI